MVVKTHIELSALWVRGQKLNSTEILIKLLPLLNV